MARTEIANLKGPRGFTGPQGVPGVNGLENDTAVAEYVNQVSQTQTAVDSRFGELLDGRFVKSAVPPVAPTADTIWIDMSGVDPGVIARYDASTLALADGAVMTSWPDVVGGRNMAGAATYVAASAKFGGMPSVRFDGVAQKMEHTGAIPTESTVILVAALTVALGTTQVILATTTATAAQQYSLWAFNGGPVFESAPSASVGAPLPSSLLRDTAPHVHGVALSAAGHRYRADGATVTGTANAFTRGGVRLGASASGGLFTAYEVAELIVFDRALSAAELAERCDSVRAKWGI